MNKPLLIATIAGALSLLITANGYTGLVPVTSPALGQFLLYAGFVSYLVYVSGFIVLGKKLDVSHLRYPAFLWLLCAFLNFMFYLMTPTEFTGTALSLIFGLQSVAIIIIGWTMANLGNRIGMLAVLYGVCAMLAGSTIPHIFGSFAAFAVDVLCYLFVLPLFFRLAKGTSVAAD